MNKKLGRIIHVVRLLFIIKVDETLEIGQIEEW